MTVALCLEGGLNRPLFFVVGKGRKTLKSSVADRPRCILTLIVNVKGNVFKSCGSLCRLMLDLGHLHSMEKTFERK